jgi:hypothetical protein
VGGLVAWLGLSATIGLVGLWFPRLPIAVALLLLGVVPASASDLLTGVPYGESTGLPSLHPATWIILFAAGFALLRQPVDFVGGIVRASPAALVLATLAGAIAIATSVLSHGAQGTSQILETYVGPPLLAALVLRELARRPHSRDHLLFSIQIYALIVAGLAVAEGLLRVDLVWAADYAAQPWHQSYGLTGFRATVFGDHPLNTALLLLACLPLMLGRFAGRFRPGVPGLLLVVAGITATGSRSGVAIALAYLVVMGLRMGRMLFPALASLVGVVWIISTLDFGQRLLARLSLDTNSSFIRFGAVSELTQNWTHFLVTGNGVGFSGEVSQALLGQSVSFENGPLMMALDIGILGAGAFLLAMCLLALRGGWRKITPVTAGFVMSLGMSVAYSSFGTKSTAGYVVWVFAALAPSIRAKSEGVHVTPTDQNDAAGERPLLVRLP